MNEPTFVVHAENVQIVTDRQIAVERWGLLMLTLNYLPDMCFILSINVHMVYMIAAIDVYFGEDDYNAREENEYVTATVVRDSSTTLERALTIQITPLTFSEAQESGLTLSSTSVSLASSK